jgi:hypothetical protein
MAGGSFGGRACRAIRARYFAHGIKALPKSWRKSWLIARIVNTPPWADFVAIRAVYARAAMLTEATGVPHEVDHVIPLQNPRVCGLHVAGNLQVLTRKGNAAKSNHWCPEQLHLFDTPEQLRLL